MAIDTIKFKRGVKSKLNNLSYGEPAYISDENELYIGTENGVEKITRNKEVAELSSQLEQKINYGDLDVAIFENIKKNNNFENDDDVLEYIINNDIKNIELTEDITLYNNYNLNEGFQIISSRKKNIKFGGTGVLFTYTYNYNSPLIVKNINFIATNSNSVAIHVEKEWGGGLVIDNSSFFNFAKGVHLNSGFNNLLTNCLFSNCGIGLKIEGQSTQNFCNLINIKNTIFLNCKNNAGIVLSNCINIVFDTCTFEHNKYHIQAYNTINKIKFNSCWFEGSDAIILNSEVEDKALNVSNLYNLNFENCNFDSRQIAVKEGILKDYENLYFNNYIFNNKTQFSIPSIKNIVRPVDSLLTRQLATTKNVVLSNNQYSENYPGLQVKNYGEIELTSNTGYIVIPGPYKVYKGKKYIFRMKSKTVVGNYIGVGLDFIVSGNVVSSKTSGAIKSTQYDAVIGCIEPNQDCSASLMITFSGNIGDVFDISEIMLFEATEFVEKYGFHYTMDLKLEYSNANVYNSSLYYLDYNGDGIADIPSGTTAYRPELLSTSVGVCYFDTTLSKPIWWNGSNWVDSNGTRV